MSLWHADADLKGVDAVWCPAGSPYGDYLRCGAIATVRAGDGEVGRRRGRGMPGAGHLQRLPGALRAGCCRVR